jgi:hypothetical protein
LITSMSKLVTRWIPIRVERSVDLNGGRWQGKCLPAERDASRGTGHLRKRKALFLLKVVHNSYWVQGLGVEKL